MPPQIMRRVTSVADVCLDFVDDQVEGSEAMVYFLQEQSLDRIDRSTMTQSHSDTVIDGLMNKLENEDRRIKNKGHKDSFIRNL